MNNRNYIEKAINYKKNVASRYVPVELGMSKKKLASFSKMLVSVKYDGHFFVIAYENEKVSLINRNGKIIDRIHLHDELESFFKSQNINAVLIAAELYLEAEKRTRVFDVTSALANGGENLKLAAFDLIELNDENFENLNFIEKTDKLVEIIPQKGNFHVAEHFKTEDHKEIASFFKERVEIGGGEGLVVKTEGFAIFKIKPIFTFDAVIVGFARSDGDRSDMVRDFLLAFRKEDGSFQIFAHMSHGFSDDDRRELLVQFQDKIVKSEYIEVARNRLAFQMVRPDTVVEFYCIDIINEYSNAIFFDDPSNNAVQTVIPDRDTPGNVAIP